MLAVTQLNRELMRMMSDASFGPFERDLVERSLIVAVRNGIGCEIEQIVTLPRERTRRRLHATVEITRDLKDDVEKLRLTFRVGGEPVIDWTWQNSQEQRTTVPGSDDLEPDDNSMIGPLTAILLLSATIERSAERRANANRLSECCTRIDFNARRSLTCASLK